MKSTVKISLNQVQEIPTSEGGSVKPVVHNIVPESLSVESVLSYLNTNGLTVDRGTWKIISAQPPSNVPLNVLSIGDSWAQGRSEGTSAYGDANPGTLYEIKGTTITEVVTDVADAVSGSPYPAMANKIMELTGRPTYLLNRGHSGAAIYRSDPARTWGSTGTLYDSMLVAVNDARTVLQGSGDIDVIYMNLGGSDAALDTINADTSSEFQLILDKLRQDIPNVKIFMNVMPGDGWWSPQMDTMRAIQQDMVANNDFVYVASDVGVISEGILFNDFLYDGLHPYHVYSEEMGVTTASNITVAQDVISGLTFILTGIAEGTYGNNTIPLTEDNLYELVVGTGTKTGGGTGGSTESETKIIETNLLAGTEIDLSNVVGNNYNFDAALSSTTYTYINPVPNGHASILINAASEPVVTGAIKISGAAFVANENLEMIVESKDGVNVRYFFLDI